MSYRIEANDDKDLVLVNHDPGCGCCAESYVINGEHGWYTTQTKTPKELGDDLRFEISWMREKIRDLQQYALEHDIDLRQHAQSENLPTPWEAENMPADMAPEQVTMTVTELSNMGVTVAPDRLTPYEGDLG